MFNYYYNSRGRNCNNCCGFRNNNSCGNCYNDCNRFSRCCNGCSNCSRMNYSWF